MDFKSFENDIHNEKINLIRYSVYKNGKITTSELVNTYPLSNCYSVTKAFTATAIGLLYDAGFLGIDNYITDILRTELPDAYNENLHKIKIRHLLTHTPGFDEGCLFEADKYTHGTDDFLKFSLSRYIPNKPGTVFVYSNSSTYILSRIVEKLSGMPLDTVIQKHLFSKIGINECAWERCPMGHTMGATGLFIRTADMLKLGILYLNGGVWEGSRILSEEWVNMATSLQMPVSSCGFGFWIEPGRGYTATGAYTQLLAVAPDRKVVFAAHSYEKEKGDIFSDIVWKHIYV